MRFLRRAEVGLDAEMNLQLSLPEPDAAARGETRRFRLLGQSQDPDVEGPRRLFSVRWHCELHVFDCVDFHFNNIVTGRRPVKKTSPPYPSTQEPSHSRVRWSAA